MILICCFGVSFQLKTTAQEITSPSTGASEVSILGSTAVASLKAYVANDWKALSQLSPKYAEELKASLRSATRDLPKGSHLVLDDPSISRKLVREFKASLRLTVSSEWIDWESNKPVRTPFSFNVSFIKEQRRWLIVRVGSASKDLVKEYLEVKSIAEAKTLLEKESPLLNSAEALNVLEQTGGPTEERSVDRINRLVKWISEKSTNSTARADGLVRQGALLIRNQDYEDAVEKLQQGLNAWEGLDDRIQVAGTLARLNEVHTYLKDGKGRPYLARAEALYLQEPQFQTGVLWAERLYGNALFNTRQYKEALEIYEGALKKSQEWGDRGMESVFLKDIGDCQFALEDYNAARRYYLACQNLTKPNSDGAPDAWDILLSLARVSLKQLKDRSALRLMYQARRDARISKSVPGLIAAYTAIANFHLSHHRGTTVIHIYEELLSELARTADRQVLAKQLRDLYTSLTFDSGEVDVAKTIMTRALGQYKNLFTTDDYAQLLIARAGLDLMKGNVREIQSLSTEIQALPNLFEETKLFGLFLSILPPLMREQPEEVLHVLDQIQTAIRNLDIPEAPEIYALISWFRALTLFASEETAGHYDKSRVYLQKLCESEEPLEQGIGNLYLGLLYLSLADEEGKDQQQYKNLGRSHLKKSIAILDTKTEISSMFLMLAWLYKAIVHHEGQEYEEALAAIKETFALASASGMPAMFGSLKVLEADAYQGLKQMKLATEALSEGIELVEADSENVAGGAAGRIKYFEQRNVLYKKQVKLLLDQERVDEAAVFADRAKARTLLELNAQTPQPNWNKYKNYIPGMMLYMMKTLPGESSSSPKPVGPPRNNSAVPLSVQAIKELLPDSSTAILQFVLSEEGSYLLVLTGSRLNQVKWTKFKLDVDTFILNDKIQRLNAFITNNANGYTDLCRELYDLLLKPAAELLKSKSDLIIIPDGVLWSLPFQALQPTANHFLLEDYNISYTSSLAVLARMQQLNNAKRALASTTTQDVLAVGNPTFAPDQIELSDTSQPTFLSDLDGAVDSSITRRVLLKPLPGAGEEAKLLMTIYGRRSVHSLIGPAASKEAIMRNINSFRIIHLATHSILNFRSAFDSAIVLEHSQQSRKRTRRGTDRTEVRQYAVLLTAREVSDMKLRAELVVLSACDTAGGAISEGEGMVGLTWAFAAAGVPAIVASQWAVNDETTTELMGDFHKRLSASSIGGHVRGTAAALRAAALDLAGKKEYRHPYYWAGFIAVGDVR